MSVLTFLLDDNTNTDATSWQPIAWCWPPLWRVALLIVVGWPLSVFAGNVLANYIIHPSAARHDYELAQQQVLSRLKCPATAKFPSIDTPGVWVTNFVEHSDLIGDFSVHSYVDAQNGFGAIVRIHWDGFFNSDGSVVDLQLKQQ